MYASSWSAKYTRTLTASSLWSAWAWSRSCASPPTWSAWLSTNTVERNHSGSGTVLSTTCAITFSPWSPSSYSYNGTKLTKYCQTRCMHLKGWKRTGRKLLRTFWSSLTQLWWYLIWVWSSLTPQLAKRIKLPSHTSLISSSNGSKASWHYFSWCATLSSSSGSCSWWNEMRSGLLPYSVM